MQILTINTRNFQKPSRKPSNRTKLKILKKNFLDCSSKKFGSAYAQSPRKCSKIKILAKIEGKEAKFFSKVYKGHIRIWFRSKKKSKLSHACVPLSIGLSQNWEGQTLLILLSSPGPSQVAIHSLALAGLTCPWAWMIHNICISSVVSSPFP